MNGDNIKNFGLFFMASLCLPASPQLPHPAEQHKMHANDEAAQMHAKPER